MRFCLVLLNEARERESQVRRFCGLCGCRKHADNKVCGGGGRGGGQDLPAHLLHDQRLPRGVHPHRLRQLQRPDERGRPHGQPEPVGHGGPGGVRPAAHALLPADQRLHHLLLHREPLLPRQRAAQVAPRGVAPLPQRARPAGGHQAGPARRRRDRQEAEGAGPGAHHAAAGQLPGQADRGRQVHGVLGAAAGGRAGGVRRGRARRALPRRQEEHQEVRALIVRRGGSARGHGHQAGGPSPPCCRHICFV